MTVLTFFALWFCASILAAGVWVACALFTQVHQRGLARLRADDERQER